MQQTKRYAYIDVLRGLAALLVVYQHTAELTLNPALQVGGIQRSVVEFFTKVIGVGEVGVCLFLMISGFVVPFSLLKYRSDPIKKFAAHRVLRLYPAYWLSVPLGAVFVYWRLGIQYGGHDIGWATLLVNFSMLQAFLGFDDVMGQYWTLALELVFYTLCAALFYFRRLSSFKSALWILIAITALKLIAKRILPTGSHLLNELALFQYLGFMFFGIFYRRWLLEDDKKAGFEALAMLAFTFASFGALADIRHAIGGERTALERPLTHLAAVAIFVWGTRIRPMSLRAGVFLGKISYSIYLFHPIVFYPLFMHWFDSSPWRSDAHLFIGLSMALSILVAYVSYRLIESPCMAMGSRMFPINKGKPVQPPQSDAASTAFK